MAYSIRSTETHSMIYTRKPVHAFKYFGEFFQVFVIFIELINNNLDH